MAFDILIFNFFSGEGGRDGKALLVTFAICRPIYKENQDSLGF